MRKATPGRCATVGVSRTYSSSSPGCGAIGEERLPTNLAAQTLFPNVLLPSNGRNHNLALPPSGMTPNTLSLVTNLCGNDSHDGICWIPSSKASTREVFTQVSPLPLPARTSPYKKVPGGTVSSLASIATILSATLELNLQLPPIHVRAGHTLRRPAKNWSFQALTQALKPQSRKENPCQEPVNP